MKISYNKTNGAFGRFLWVLLIFFILSFGYIIGWSISNTFFLKRFGVEFYPIMFIINGIVVLIGSYIYLKFVDRIRATTLFRWICLLFTLIIGISILLIKLNNPLAYPFFIVIVEIAKVVFLMQMFTLFSVLFSPFESKKYLPFVMLGALGGYVIGGLMVNVFTGIIDLTVFLWIWIMTLLFSILLLSILERRYKNRFLLLEEYKSEKFSNNDATLKDVIAIPLARTLGLVRMLTFFVIFIIFFTFIKKINVEFNSEESLAKFLSFYAAATAFIILFLQIFFVKIIFKLVGIRKSLYALPGFLFLGSAVNGVQPSFWGIVGTQFGRDVLQNSVNTIGLNLLYPTFPKRIRGEVRSFIEGVMGQVGLSLAGIFLLHSVFDNYQLTFVILAIICFVILLLIHYANKKFLIQMLHNLSTDDKELVSNTLQLFGEKQNKNLIPWFLILLKRSPDVEYQINLIKSLGLIGDKQIIRPLIPYTIHENKSIRLAALESISNFKKENLLYILLMIIAKEKDPEVVDYAIQSIGKYNENTIHHLTSYLKDDNPRIKASAIDAIGSFRKEENSHLFVAFLDDHNPMVRASVVAAIYRFKKDKELCENTLKELMSGTTTEDKKAACFAIGEARIKDHFSYLESMFYEDNDPEVKLNAVDAMIKVGELQSEYMIVSLITNKNEDLAKQAARLLQHLSSSIRQKIIEAVLAKEQDEVEYVKNILLDCGVFYKEENEMLSRFR